MSIKHFFKKKQFKLLIIILFTFISIQLINGISILSQFIEKEKKQLIEISHTINLIIKNEFYEKKFLQLKKSLENKGIKIFLKSNSWHDKNSQESFFEIIKDTISKQKTLLYNDSESYYNQKKIILKKNISDLYISTYKSIFVSSIIGLLFILFGIIFASTLMKNLRHCIYKNKKKLKIKNIYLQILFLHTKNGIVSLDENGYIDSMNPYASEIFQNSRNKLKTVDNLDIYQNSKKIEKVNEFSILSKRSKEAKIIKEKLFDIDYYMIPIRLENRMKWILFIYNITYRKKIEKKQKKLIEKLKQSNNEIQDIAYGLSHDIKAPLKTIKSFISIIMENPEIQKMPEHLKDLKIILEKINYLSFFINEILNYFKTPFLKEKNIEINLNELIKEILLLLKNEKNIKIYIQKKLPILRKDRSKIIQIFQNLISNAIKFSHETNGQIYIECIEKKTKWIFSIKDNGIGIEQKYYTDIFKIFKKIPNHNFKNSEGSGIGLSIVKKILDNWKEKIWIVSEKNKGSQFFFTLKK